MTVSLSGERPSNVWFKRQPQPVRDSGDRAIIAGHQQKLHHRLLASESVTRHTLFREETRWPGYYYRGDHPKLDDQNWHCFTLSRYDRRSGEWAMEKAPVYHIID